MAGRNVGGVEIDIRGDRSHFTREMLAVERQSRRSAAGVKRDFQATGAEATRLNAKIKGVATSMLALTAALGVGAGLARGARTIADFGQAMSTLEAVTGATGAQVVALSKEAQRLGSTTRFSASQAAEGMIFLARAGFTASEALEAVEGTLQLAQAGGLDLGRAADIASNVLGGFNLNVAETGRVVDVLALAANSANVTVNGLGEALKFAAPTASALGLSLEETVAAIGKLGDSGLAGGLGGRGFSALATTFVAKKDEITALIGEFNLAEEGLNRLIQRLVKAGITTDQVVKIFRAENLDVFTILANASQDAAKGTEVLTNKLNDAGGTAERVAKTMDDNLNGAILGAASAFESLVLAFGELGAESGLTVAFKNLADLLRTAAANADVLSAVIVALTARALLPLAAAALTKVAPGLNAVSLASIRTTGLLTAASVAARGLGAAMLAAFTGPTALVLAAAAAYVAYTRAAADAAQKTEDARTALEKANEVLAKIKVTAGSETDSPFTVIADTADVAGGRIAALIGQLEELGAGLKRLSEEGKVALGLELTGSLLTTRDSIAALAKAEAEARRKSRDRFATSRGGLGEQRRIAGDGGAALQRFQDSENGRLLLQLRQKEAALEREIRRLEITPGDVLSQFRNGTPTAAPKAKAKSSDNSKNAEIEDQARAAAALRTELETAYQIELARAQGNEALVSQLEEAVEMEKRALDYVEAGLTLSQARLLAEVEVASLREAAVASAKAEADEAERLAQVQARYDRFQANERESEEVQRQAEEIAEAARERLTDAVSRAFEDGIRSGDWGTAFGTILAESFADSMRSAIRNLADDLVNLLGSVLGNINIGGGGVGNFFGSIFGGARAGGGGVNPGQRYLVGESGPEWFIPDSPGYVEANATRPNASGGGALTGGGLYVDASLNVAGNITDDVLPKVQAMLAEQSRQLPGMIDARVGDGRKRGRF